MSKTPWYTNVMKKVILLCLIATFPVILICQEVRISALQNNAGIRIDFDTLLTENSLLEPFRSSMIISGLAFSGEIILRSDSSLVRIVLMDKNYNEYLIYETFPILSGSRQFSIQEAGEETSILNNIIPTRVSIELVDASIYLQEFIISQEDIYQAKTKGALLFQQTKHKIDRINQNIQKLGQTWVAGETSISRLSYQEKKRMFGGSIPNFQGFEYYVGGIFVLPGALSEDSDTEGAPSINYTQQESLYPAEFSWKNRHGSDWITPVKNQGNCGSCYSFGTTAAAELLVNLYFNRHKDYDLSEQQLVSCQEGSCEDGGSPREALDFMVNTGIVLEECYPYKESDLDCSEVCSNPSEQIQIAYWNSVVVEEDIKREIIAGATAALIYLWEHCALLVGYKVLEAGDNLFVGGYDTTSYISLDENSPLIGQTAWLCKNSWGESWGNRGYGYFIAGKLSMSVLSLQGPVNSLIFNDNDIRCTDNDGDGYYNWGIGPKPTHCPNSPDESDGDDSDPCRGPLDEFGNFTSSTPTPEAEDTIILYGSSPDLYINGSNVRWYSDKGLQNHVHTGGLFPVGNTEPGKYTYYATQSIDGCESAANEVILSIVYEIPPPKGHDTVINRKAPAILKVEGELNAEFKWYADPLLTNLLHTGKTYETVKTDTGIYMYYVTQTLCFIESAYDSVLLTISNHITIPDTAFLHALIDENVDRNGNGMISNEEAEAIVSLDVSLIGIVDMKGIEAFVNLNTLICNGNRLTRLNVSNCFKLKQLICFDNRLINLDVSNANALIELACGSNKFTTLDVSNNTTLLSLNCEFNSLTSLDVSGCSVLKYLKCSGNKLTNLDVADCSELKRLKCSANRLTSLDVSKNTALLSLNCGDNQLTNLDVLNCTALEELRIWGNQLTNMDVTNNSALLSFDCNENQLINLDVTNNTALTGLYCNYNQLTSLDISNNTALLWVICNYNQLTTLDVSGCSALKKLEIIQNQFTTLDVSGCTVLEELICINNQITSLDVSNNTALTHIYCRENQLTTLDFSNNTSLTNLYCNRNQLTNLNVSSNTALVHLLCSRNKLTTLDISMNTNLTSLRIEAIPTLEEVCVWTKEFPPEGFYLHMEGSPNVSFQADCDRVSVEEFRLSEISIYPNPTTNILTIETDQPGYYSIEINSINGQLIYSEAMEGSTHQIDLSSFQKGVYLLTIRSKEFVTTRKIIKL